MNNDNKPPISWCKLILLFVLINHFAILQPAHASAPQLLTLRLGFTSGTLFDVDVNDARAAQEIWLRSVLQNVNQSKQEIGIITIVYNNIAAACEGIKKDEIDAIIILPLEYLALCKEVSMIPIMTSRSEDDEGDHYVIVTYKKDKIQNIEQLQSKRLIMNIKGSNAVPKVWLDTLLLEKTLPSCETFFSTIKRVGKSTQAILPVFFKQADVCLVPKTDLDIAMELNPQLKTNLKILHQSPGYNRIIVCVQNAFYKKYGDLLSDTIEVANSTKQGQQLFTLFRIKKLSPFENTHLDNIKKLAQKYQTLSNTSIIP